MIVLITIAYVNQMSTMYLVKLFYDINDVYIFVASNLLWTDIKKFNNVLTGVLTQCNQFFQIDMQNQRINIISYTNDFQSLSLKVYIQKNSNVTNTYLVNFTKISSYIKYFIYYLYIGHTPLYMMCVYENPYLMDDLYINYDIKLTKIKDDDKKMFLDLQKSFVNLKIIEFD